MSRFSGSVVYAPWGCRWAPRALLAVSLLAFSAPAIADDDDLLAPLAPPPAAKKGKKKDAPPKKKAAPAERADKADKGKKGEVPTPPDPTQTLPATKAELAFKVPSGIKGARLYVDDRDVGPLPSTHFEILPGEHSIVVKRLGHA